MGTTVIFERRAMMGAGLGGENPLPGLAMGGDIHREIRFDASVPQDERKYFGYGTVDNMLPYRMQDQYDRDLRMREYEVAVLENDFLRAEFLPQYGGRLWTLYDKEHGRDLIYRNPIFQPANLALRNAWVAGGVEWNLGMTGHCPLGLSPVHTAVLERKDGTPVLRMYEWERIRQVTFQLDAYLPENARFLFVRVRLYNTRGEEVPAYWWSNIAVEETEGTRVLAPAREAFFFDYTRRLFKKEMPLRDGKDCSYTLRMDHAMDIFFDIPECGRKWEAVLDKDGEGLVQTSTDRLQGRKLFLWGAAPGGRRWQEYLSGPGKAYLEIQAGLAKTQMEQLPMPAHACWEWLEAYGMLRADPKKVHGEWGEACTHIEDVLEKALPRAFAEEELKRLGAELAQAASPVRRGSGWGALELMRREGGAHFGEEWALFEADSLGEDQAPWAMLLGKGVFPGQAVNETPAAYMGQKEWIPLLLESIQSGRSDHWHAWLQLGILYCAQKEWRKAEEAFDRSVCLADNGWARRNLAVLWLQQGKTEEALEEMGRAAALLPVLPIAAEYGKMLCGAEHWESFRDFYGRLPKEMRENGRLRLLNADAAAHLGLRDEVFAYFAGGGAPADVREGEETLSELWVFFHREHMLEENPEWKKLDEGELARRILAAKPLPHAFDFRMKN